MNGKQSKILFILIIVLIFIDQILKFIILATNIKIGNPESWSIGILNSEKTENNLQYILISIIAVIFIIRYMKMNNSFIKMNSKVILSFAVAGAISNTIDRIWNKATIDYINISKSMSLNLAYVYILITWVGMAIILTKYTSDRIKERKIQLKKGKSRS